MIRMATRVSFCERHIDVVLQDENGVNYGVEVKSSLGAFNRNDADARRQFAADRWTNDNGAQPIGQNAKMGQIEGTSKIIWKTN